MTEREIPNDLHDTPSVSATIVIPTYNRSHLLRDALTSIVGVNLPARLTLECLIVDNNSTDDTRSVSEAFAAAGNWLAMRYVREERQGLNFARNRGLAESQGAWTVFLDDDMLIDKDWFISFESAIALGEPDLVTGPVEPMFEGEIPRWCVPRVLDSVTSSYSLKGEVVRRLESDEAHEVPGCNFAVKTAFGRAIGGFHPELDRSGDLMLAGGDSEFGIRAAKAGGHMIYVPGCRIRHLVSVKKMSQSGLIARWRGLGATEKRIRELHPRPIPRRSRLRQAARIWRLRTRSWLSALSGNAEAFRWKLEAERLKASL